MNYRKIGIASILLAPVLLLKMLPSGFDGQTSFFINYLADLIFTASMICSVISIYKFNASELMHGTKNIFILLVVLLFINFLSGRGAISLPGVGAGVVERICFIATQAGIILLCVAIKSKSWFNSLKQYIIVMAIIAVCIGISDFVMVNKPLLPLEYISCFLLCASLAYASIASSDNEVIQDNVLYELSTL